MNVRIISQIILLFFVFLLFPELKAQQSLSGKVIDKETGEALPGVNVVIKGTSIGSVTDLDGNYKLAVGDRADTVILVFTYVGYKSVEVTLGSQSTIDIALESEEDLLDEIVVVGYGIEKRKVSTAATSLVKAESIEKLPILRTEQALQGQVAGVSVSQNSGAPGSNLSVLIRGVNSFGNTQPLFVVDGVPTGGIDFLAPDDIERIDVLKDGASAAIYGILGASNGVVLITTKKGKKDRFDVNYSGYYGIQEQQRKVELLNGSQYNELYSFGTPLALGRSESFDTDWQEAIIGQAPITNHNLTLSGGKDNDTYLFGLNYYDQFGIVGAGSALDKSQNEKSRHKRITFRSNASVQLNKRMSLTVNLQLGYSQNRTLPQNQDFGSIIPLILNSSPAVPIYDVDQFDNNGMLVYEGSGDPFFDTRVNPDLSNPVSRILNHNQKYNRFRTFDNISFNYEIIDGLKFFVNGNLDFSEDNQQIFTPRYSFISQGQSLDNRIANSFTEQRFRFFNRTVQSTFSYERQIQDHFFKVLVGYAAHEANYEELNAGNNSIAINNFDGANLGLGQGTIEDQTNGNAITEYTRLSYFARLSYNYKERYSFTSNFRIDGSSRLGSENRYGTFLSASSAWIISEENFFQEASFAVNDIVSFAKLRLSTAVIGNDNIPEYGFVTQVNSGFPYVFGPGTGENQIQGASAGVVANEEISFERTLHYDAGLELGFFNNRLYVNTDVFYKEGRDLLVENTPVPPQLGLTGPTTNLATVSNQGVEVEVKYQGEYRDFKYSVSGNFTYIKNEVLDVDLPGEQSESFFISAGNLFHLTGNNAVSRTQIESPIAAFFGYETLGIFQDVFEVRDYVDAEGNQIQENAQPGDFKFRDVNGDGMITPEGDVTMIGKPTPDFLFGMTINLSYKNFDFSVLAQGSAGNDVYRGYAGYGFGPFNPSIEVLEAWNGSGTSNTVPALSSNPATQLLNPNNRSNSDYFVEDASFLKIRNIQLGYSIPSKILDRAKIKGLRFHIAVQNAFTFTKYSGLDPEVGSDFGDNGRSLAIGIDRGFYPAARTYIFGLKLNL